MGISVVLDVVIGLCFIYFLLALFCSWINEYAAVWTNRRGALLFDGIRELLQSKTHLDAFVTHPLIESLDKVGSAGAPTRTAVNQATTDEARKEIFPSYMPANTFATVLLDLIAPANAAAGAGRFAQASEAISKLPADSKLRGALQTLVNRADNDIEALRKGVEDWYASTMDRVSGWYRKNTQNILFGIGFVAAVVLNVDTFQIARELWNNPAARNQAVESAAQTVRSAKAKDGVASPVDVDAALKDLKTEQDAEKKEKILRDLLKKYDVRDQLATIFASTDQAALPFGWREAALPWKETRDGKVTPIANPETVIWNVIVKFLGILVTGCAVALGAPFWFELVNKLVDIRGAGRKPEEKK